MTQALTTDRTDRTDRASISRDKTTASGRRWKRAATPLALVLAAATLGACQTTGGGHGPKQGWGTILGAGAGALAGSQVGQGRGQLAAVAIGALAGGMIGNEIGASLDRADRRYAARAQDAALNGADWETVTWSNPDSGHAGSVTPMRTLRHGRSGRVCREYRTTVTIGGRVEEGYGTACRMPGGGWRIVS